MLVLFMTICMTIILGDGSPDHFLCCQFLTIDAFLNTKKSAPLSYCTLGPNNGCLWWWIKKSVTHLWSVTLERPFRCLLNFGSFCDDLNESAVCQNHSLEGRKASTQASRRNCDINVETQTKHSSKNNSRNEPAKLRKWAKQGPSKLRVEKFGPTKLLPRISFTSWYKAKKPPIQIIRKLLVIPFRRYVTSQH